MNISIFFTYCFYILLIIFIINLFIDIITSYIIDLLFYLINSLLLNFLSLPFVIIKHLIPYLDVILDIDYLKIDTSLPIYVFYLLMFVTVFFISCDNRKRKILKESKNIKLAYENISIDNNISDNIIYISKKIIHNIKTSIIKKKDIIKQKIIKQTKYNKTLLSEDEKDLYINYSLSLIESKKREISKLKKDTDSLYESSLIYRDENKEIFNKLKSIESLLKFLNNTYMKDKICDKYDENRRLTKDIDFDIKINEDLLLDNKNDVYFIKNILSYLDKKKDLLHQRLIFLLERCEIEKTFNKLLKQRLKRYNIEF